MSVAACPRFLAECIIPAPDKGPALRDDDLFGVYLSWCLLNGKRPATDMAFWAALSESGYNRQKRDAENNVWPGLVMKGPAALDYILSSQPSLV